MFVIGGYLPSKGTCTSLPIKGLKLQESLMWLVAMVDGGGWYLDIDIEIITNNLDLVNDDNIPRCGRLGMGGG